MEDTGEGFDLDSTPVKNQSRERPEDNWDEGKSKIAGSVSRIKGVIGERKIPSHLEVADFLVTQNAVISIYVYSTSYISRSRRTLL
jgi:hypothetical protein